MKNVAIVAVAAGLSLASIAGAQTAAPASTPAPAVMKPTLISDLEIRSDDSALVRAAKTTVAARMRDASRSTGVLINDSYVRNATGGRISEAHSSAPLPSFNGPSTAQQGGGPTLNNMPNVAGVNRAAVERQQQQLRQEQGRAYQESMQPWGGDIGEDRATQRLTQIPGEMQQNQKKLNPPHP